MDNIWSVFLHEHTIVKDKKTIWVKRYSFYMGVMPEYDIKTDWRFCAVKDRRKESVFLGICETTFPVKFPLTLKDGTILPEIENQIKYDDEKMY